MICGLVIFGLMIVCGVDWLRYEWAERRWNK